MFDLKHSLYMTKKILSFSRRWESILDVAPYQYQHRSPPSRERHIGNFLFFVMYRVKHYKIVGFFTLIALFILAWTIQSNLLLNCDVSWDLLVTKRMVEGGTYTHDFFDLNPPLIFYLYTPTLLLTKLFFISDALALRIYVFGLGLISLSICSLLISRIFLREHKVIAYLILLMLAFIFFIVPVKDFGEREHLLIIFTMPYFLAVIYRLQGNTLKPWHALGIGLFSVLGFAMKPHFLMCFILVELYIMRCTRSLWGWWRIEVLTIFVFLLCYSLFVFVFYSDYLFTLVPKAMRFYHLGFSEPLSVLLTTPLMFFCYFTVLFYTTQLRTNPYLIMSSVFLIAGIGFLSSFVIQGTNWFYHLFPAYSFALLLITLLLGIIGINHPKKYSIVLLVAIAVYFMPLAQIQAHYLSGLESKKNQSTLSSFLRMNAQHEPVYFIYVNVPEAFPAVINSGSIFASRLLHLFWIPGVVKNALMYHSQYLNTKEAIQDEDFFINMVAEDIETKKPKYVLVDSKRIKSDYYFLPFDFLPYLLKNSHFQRVWEDYHYIKTIERFPTQKDEGVALYLAKNKNDINPKEIQNKAIILTGTGKNKIAYYVKNHAFIQKNKVILKLKVTLTEKELAYLSRHHEQVNKIGNKNKIINQIIKRAYTFPAYRYAIYQRQEKQTPGIDS